MRVHPQTAPIIADAVQGLAKIIESNYSPEAKRKKALGDLELARAQKLLASVDDPTAKGLKQQQLINAQKTGALIDARVNRVNNPVVKPSKSSEIPPHLQQYYNPDLTPIEPDLPVAEDMPLGGVDVTP